MKPGQVNMLIAEELLSSHEDIDGIIQEGWRKLRHTCGKSCLMRIGFGNGLEIGAVLIKV